MLKLNEVYRLKEIFGPPYRYLGDNVNKLQLEDGRTVCYMNRVEYLRGAITNVDLIIEGNKAVLK